jgi:hypothetical protein
MTCRWHPRLSRRATSFASGLAVSTAVLALFAAGLAASATLAGCTTPAPPDSGVRGTVRVGPISPVQQQGDPSDAPYEASLVVRTSSGSVVARTRSAADGSFSVNLAPGEYTIEGEGPGVLPSPPAPEPFTVQPHAFTSVTLVYDSGIR